MFAAAVPKRKLILTQALAASAQARQRDTLRTLPCGGKWRSPCNFYVYAKRFVLYFGDFVRELPPSIGVIITDQSIPATLVGSD